MRVRYADFMLRSLLGLPSVVADYTFGTVIVLVQLAIVGPGQKNSVARRIAAESQRGL
jgi:hypothetical protein